MTPDKLSKTMFDVNKLLDWKDKVQQQIDAVVEANCLWAICSANYCCFAPNIF